MDTPREFSLTFGGAGEQEIKARGRYLRLYDTPSAAVYVSVGGGSEVLRQAGQSVNVSGHFDRFRIRSTVAQTVRVAISDVPQDDNAQSVAVSVSATISPGATLTAGGDVSCLSAVSTQVAAANLSRKSIIIANLTSNTDPVRVGGVGVTATGGYELLPGDSIELAVTSAVYVYNTGAGAQSVNVLEIQ